MSIPARRMLVRGGRKFALAYNGTTNYVLVSGSESIVSEWSMSLWFKAPKNLNRRAFAGRPGQFVIEINNNVLRIFMLIAATIRTTISIADTLWAANTWHHLAYTLKDTTSGGDGITRGYIDGSLVATGSAYAGGLSILTPARIGAHSDGLTEVTFYDGILSAMRWYDRKFAPDEIKLLSTGHPISSVGLRAHWPLVEGSGLVANDISGNGNHGSLLPALTPPTWTTDTPL